MWPHLRDYNELVFDSSAGPPDRGKLLDKAYDEDNTGFVGSGMRLLREKLPAAKVITCWGWACSGTHITLVPSMSISSTSRPL